MVNKKLKLLPLIAVILLSASLMAQPDIGLKGVGGRAGLVNISDGVGSTINFGGVVNLGTIMPNLALVANVDFWTKGFDTGISNTSSSVRDLSVAAGGRYYIPLSDGGITPYAAGGLALHFYNASSEGSFTNPFTGQQESFDSSAGSTEFGIDAGGGVELPINESLDGFGEVILRINGGDLQILFNVGALFNTGG